MGSFDKAQDERSRSFPQDVRVLRQAQDGRSLRSERQAAADAAAAALKAADWAVPVEAMDRWFAAAAVGDRLLYAQGAVLVRGPASERARALYEAGLADLRQPRSQGRPGFDYQLVKRADAAAAARVAAGPSDGLDQAAQKILTQLKREANLGRRASSNTALAGIAGLPTKAQAGARIAKLVAARLIRTFHQEDGPDAGWRVVEICASGKRTQAPPSWAALKRAVAEDEQ